MEGKRIPKIWEIVSERRVYSDAHRTRKDVEKMICDEGLADFLRGEEAALYRMGYAVINRSMLRSKSFRDLPAAAKSVLLWLIAKDQIIAKKKEAGIDDEETRAYPAVTATNKEIALYAGINEKCVQLYVKALREAGLIMRKKRKTGGRTDTTLYQVPGWEIDDAGYFLLPLKTVVTPAWIALSHNAKTVYLYMLSEHNAAQYKISKAKVAEEEACEEDRFPTFRLTYGQMKDLCGISSRTAKWVLRELSKLGFIHMTRGIYDEETGKREMNEYVISADHLHIFKNHAAKIAADIQRERANKVKYYKRDKSKDADKEADAESAAQQEVITGTREEQHEHRDKKSGAAA